MAATVATVAASGPAADTADAAAAEQSLDQLFTLSGTSSRWTSELDNDCAAFLHVALACARGDRCTPVVIGNIAQMEAAVRNVKVLVLGRI